MSRPLRRGVSPSIALLLLLAACSGTGASPTAAPTTAPTSAPSVEPSTAPASEAPSTAAKTYEVSAASGTVGSYLIGDNGMTLYTFKNDSAGKSACSGQCATNWPPFGVTASDTVKAGAGVSGTFGTITRDDGSTQVTYNDAPLYYFAADKAPGDTTGQGVNNVWFVAAP